MKKPLLISTLLLLSSLAFAEPKTGKGDKPRYAIPETGSMLLLGMSLCTIVGGLILRYPRSK